MITGLISFLTFLLGLILGHWLAIGRDKRKEFNEAVAPVRGWLLGAKDTPNPYLRLPSEQEFDRFIHYLWPWQRSAFRNHLSAYKSLHNSLQVRDAVGQVSYHDDKQIRRELNALFKFTGRR